MSGIGSIKVELYTGNEADPVPFGQAVITRTVNGILVFSQTVMTDENGQSESVIVETPDLPLSFDPFSIDDPYYEYNIQVTAQAYTSVLIQNVQVFPDTEALQKVEMIPQFQASSDSPTRGITANEIVYDIPPNALRQTGGSGVTPFAECSGPWVLTEVYIPTYITVHLGKPSNTSAKNVTVPFIDYIKNVASSEIFPTWPDASLRANIYCQISLALNRVFTEWYKSKGYNYQITNSTQYDQYYVHGRNIFDNISKIVDELFNDYLRRTGDFAPFYAEYCNGTTATCPGLSQWGTVDLANQGLSPIQIIRRYYGNNIEIVECNKFQDIQESYPGTPLRLGSTGFDVKIIQRQLNRISRNYPAINKVTEDGVFGPTTEQAVKTFQRVFNLTQDGVVGKATWYKISYIYVAVKKLAELGSEAEPYPPASEDLPVTSLQLGDRGPGVTQLQYYLSYLSGFYTQINNITVDGIFGPATETAVKQFQQLFGLVVDGKVGSATWAEIVKQYDSLSSDENPPGSYPGEYPGVVLQLGSRGPSVKEMQYYLEYLSAYYPTIPKINADGIFGPATETAVRSFQSYFGLAVDGKVGLQTWTKLYEVYSDIKNGIIEGGQRPGEYPGYILREGSEGQKVKELQFYLSVLANKYPSIPLIKVDGKFGPATKQAVLAFQKYFGLTQDGLVGPETWARIYQEYYNIRLTREPGCNFVTISYPGTPLKLNDSGDIVKVLQYYLDVVAYFDPLLETIPVNGVYDDTTVEAVTVYQRARGFCPTGVVDEQLWANIYSEYTAVFQALYPECVSGTYTYPGYDLSEGDQGIAVYELQGYLNVIGRFYCGIVPIAQDGIFGPETKEAVIDFQELFNLPQTGIVDEATWNEIYQVYSDLSEIAPPDNADNQYSGFYVIYPDKTVDQTGTTGSTNTCDSNCVNCGGSNNGGTGAGGCQVSVCIQNNNNNNITVQPSGTTPTPTPPCCGSEQKSFQSNSLKKNRANRLSYNECCENCRYTKNCNQKDLF